MIPKKGILLFPLHKPSMFLKTALLVAICIFTDLKKYEEMSK